MSELQKSRNFMASIKDELDKVREQIKKQNETLQLTEEDRKRIYN